MDLLDACLGPAKVNVEQNSVGAFGDKHLEEMWATELVRTISDPRQTSESEDSSEVLDTLFKDLLVYERDDRIRDGHRAVPPAIPRQREHSGRHKRAVRAVCPKELLAMVDGPTDDERNLAGGHIRTRVRHQART